MNRLAVFFIVICMLPVLVLAEDEPAANQPSDSESVSDEAKIPLPQSTSKLGLSRVVVDGQAIYVSRGVADIIDKEGEADLVDDNRILCQHLHRTGTNITLRQCRTRVELEELAEETGDRMNDIYRRVFRSCAVKRVGPQELVGC